MYPTYRIYFICSWYMQYSVNTLVFLFSQESDCVYWSKDKKTFGDTEVQVASIDTFPAFISRNMLIRHVKVIQQLLTL